MSTTPVPTNEECAELWTRLDYNGNGMLSLAELDKGVIELWPDLNHKPAIMRAYKATDVNGDGFIRKNEFRFFLKFIHFYNELWTQFATTDVDNDRRLDRDEFQKEAEKLGISEGIFDEIDTNNGGYVLFDEFCAYMAKHDSA
jgi:Ca2+-binding EF-hand superfamily protein